LTNYQTLYPLEIQLINNQIVRLSDADNKGRVLITEVETEVQHLRYAFSKDGFDDVIIMEVVKENQIGNGMRKHINKYWDMHVRFLALHEGLIAIDGEVETNMDYLEHVIADNWISVIYEVWNVVKKVTSEIHLFHKGTGLYVRQILKDTSMELRRFSYLIEWKPIVFGIAVFVIVIVLFAALTALAKKK